MMKLKIIAALIALFLSSVTFAKSNGIIITFEQKSKAKLQELHKKYNTKVSYTSTTLPKQAILSNVADLNFNDDYLKTLCKLYLENSFIKKCELNEEVKSQVADGQSCTELDNTVIQVTGLGSWMSDVSDTLGSCKITDPLKLGNIKNFFGETEILSGIKNSELSPLWAQEYIGADLAYSYMEAQNAFAIKETGKPLTVKDGVIDREIYKDDLKRYKMAKGAFSDAKTPATEEPGMNHGSAVISLMVDKTFGVSPVAELSLVQEAQFAVDVIMGIDKSIDNGTQIINYSAETPRVLLDSMKKANKNGIIIVTTAGNDFDRGIHQISSVYKDYDQILVGSLAPLGYVSDFSQQGKEVTVLAPSDYWVQAYAKNHMRTFSGTSGAAPLVKGSLDNVLAQVPGLTTKQLKVLIKKTAIGVIANHTEGDPTYNNGVGMINAYKLARVASKLRLMVKGLREPMRSTQINKLINSSDLYDFTRDANSKYSMGIKMLKSENCNERIEGLKQLRGAYLLDQSEESRKKLVEVYESEGRSVNAEFYKSVAKDREHYINTMNNYLYLMHLDHSDYKKLPREYSKAK